MAKSAGEEAAQTSLTPLFGKGFLDDHAGHIIADPKIALVELVANAWDAGARNVSIEIPDKHRGLLAIEDDGTGMTREQFENRWRVLSYNRLAEQGSDVKFPGGANPGKRKAFGRNGKGRHALFAFADEYEVRTRVDGKAHAFSVKRASGGTPFSITHLSEYDQPGHGTLLSVNVLRNLLTEETVRSLLGSRFVADPSFRIQVNGEPVELTDLADRTTVVPVSVPPYGDVKLLCIDAQAPGRTMKNHGVAWWVNNRLVGMPSWGSLDGTFLDGRSPEAKRYTFVAVADCLEEDVKADWSGFRASQRSNAVRVAVEAEIVRTLRTLMQDQLKATKRAVIAEYRQELRELTPLSQEMVGQFVDRIQMKCPTMSPRDLTNVTQVLINLESSRAGYDLLRQLADLPPDDLDSLNTILDKWSVSDAQLVLDELGRRLRLIKDLEKLVHNPKADELHDLQPIFERGLWIFGAEYETVQFTSNRTLATTLRKFFGEGPLQDPNHRADFVILPEGSIGVYASDAYDTEGNVSGIEKIVLLELKRGGFHLTRKEVNQASDYAADLRNSGRIQASTKIVAFVLGSTIDAAATAERVEENNRIIARDFDTVLRQAHNRTFNLQKKIQASGRARVRDEEVRAVLAQQTFDAVEREVLTPVKVTDTPAESLPETFER